MKILINQVEIKTKTGLAWSGSKEGVSRQVTFDFLYNPLKDFPQYKVNVGNKVQLYTDDDVLLFTGMIYTIDYSTEQDTISFKAYDLLNNMVKSKAVGRWRGTLNEVADVICKTFGLKSAITSENKLIHNIISTGDLTYYDILYKACKAIYGDKFNIIVDGANNVKLCPVEPVASLEIRKNIITSNINSSIENMINSVVIVDNEGKVKNTLNNQSDWQKYGLFREVYLFNEDVKNNNQEAEKMLKSEENTISLTAISDINCISGNLINIIEPVNNLQGIFRIVNDNHNLDTIKTMDLEVEYVG